MGGGADDISHKSSDWRDRNGNRNVPYLWNDSGERNLNLNWRENDWNEDYRFLAFREHIHCFSCFFHPPIILPTSARGMDTAAYFFASSIFTSQPIRKRSFRRLVENPTDETLQSYLGLLGHGNTRKIIREIKLL